MSISRLNKYVDLESSVTDEDEREGKREAERPVAGHSNQTVAMVVSFYLLHDDEMN